MPGRLYALVDFDLPYEKADQIEMVPELEANVETSISDHQPNPHVMLHKPQLDLDIPHTYRYSSTPGNGHLSLDIEVPWEKYVQWLELSAELGIIQKGWVQASKARKFTALRRPGIKKEKPSNYNTEPAYPEVVKDPFDALFKSLEPF